MDVWAKLSWTLKWAFCNINGFRVEYFPYNTTSGICNLQTYKSIVNWELFLFGFYWEFLLSKKNVFCLLVPSEMCYTLCLYWQKSNPSNLHRPPEEMSKMVVQYHQKKVKNNLLVWLPRKLSLNKEKPRQSIGSISKIKSTDLLCKDEILIDTDIQHVLPAHYKDVVGFVTETLEDVFYSILYQLTSTF